MSDSSSIPVHSLTDRTSLGLEIHRIDVDTFADEFTIGVHRDDYYIFLFQQTGETRMMLDFKEICFDGCTAFCVLPGQVHHSVSSSGSSGWFLALDPSLLDDVYRSVFEEYSLHVAPVMLTSDTAKILQNIFSILVENIGFQQGLPFQTQVLRSLIQACTGTFASIFQQHKQENFPVNSRPATITGAFKKLVVKQYKSMKSPAAYAGALSITSSYLNEVVKNITGFSATYWIQYEIILEAKRLLSYTDLTVKEISFRLGYEDPAYFSRLFHKITKETPLSFRRKYRK